MTYHFKHQITNPIKSISDKVNFFADYFDFALMNFGRLGFQQLENHKSLLEKIKFHLDNYSGNSNQYIKHYFENQYLSHKDWLIAEYYSNEWKIINKLKLKTFVNLSNENQRNELNKEITKLIKKLDESLFENALNKIIVTISCTQPLKKHNHSEIFEYYTNLILSEFIFAGFPKEDLKKVFDKILANEVKLENNEVLTDVPLPQTLLDIKNNPDNKPEIFYAAVEKYLQNRTLQQQFEGIYHLFKGSSNDKTYVFKLSNVSTSKSISLIYNNVLFSNQLKKKYVKRGITSKIFRTFFNGKGNLFAEVTVKENNGEVGKSNAILKVNNALNYLNSTLDKKAKIETDDYIIRENHKGIRHRSYNEVIYPEDEKIFIKNNPHKILNVNNKTISQFLILDSIYFQGLNEAQLELKIVHYWRYIESFFESQDYNSKNIKTTLSQILSKNNTPNLLFNYYNLAYHIVHAAYYNHIKSIDDRSGINHFFNVTDNELRNLTKPQPIDDINFKRLKEIINHPYITKKFSWLLKSSKDDKIKLAYDFYMNTLTEAYEQRNFVEHSGIHCNKSVEKVLLTLPEITKQFRSLMINELKTGMYNSFNEVINKLQTNN